MDNFTVGDRCLVHHLESEAGQPLNGQHVTLVDVIIQNGWYFACRFDDGSFANIKPCNLQIINGDCDHQTMEKCEGNSSSNLNKKEDDDKIKNAYTSVHYTFHRPHMRPASTYIQLMAACHQEQEQQKAGEECSMCLYVLPKDTSKIMRATCCGKGMHLKCRELMVSSKMESKNRCVMCRTLYPAKICPLLITSGF